MKNEPHRNISELLLHSNRAQIKKLKRDKHKPDFLAHDLKELQTLKNNEDIELNDELDKIGNPNNYESFYDLLTAIEEESSDVLNFCSMIILKCKELKGEL